MSPTQAERVSIVTDVCFSRVKLGFALVACVSMFPLGVALVIGGGLKSTVVGAAMAIASPFVSLYVARYLLDNKILSVRTAGIEFHGILSTRRLRMDQIATITVETQTTKGGATSSLIIKPREGHGRRIKLSEGLLEKRFGGCEGVAELIANGAPEPQREPFPLPRRTPQPPSAAPDRARAGGFGRKGL
jgi:hypothetical protein